MFNVVKISSLFILLSGVAATPVSANDFPTVERVKFVQECMALKGGPNYVNMYGCSCVIDKIADTMTFEEYTYADAFVRLKNMRGERGGYFRSSKDSRTARKGFLTLKEDAEQQCFVGQQITQNKNQ
ncbi:hypothetical protein [Enterovibrio nigricans]|uniref:Uncharacterized protein n=1 Tax=Enterovibrio nigricans DSM 22720 TaxID=1121868 RepID=A0A1T4U1P0_9GAMM|nr:hypothetical protein [Enterovibrio nigricans]PKF50702.1 hypothetical protein AT251_09470 [Enterovibrio nigricans]SKA46441.1 hypothetical protein SAMN02745132_00525 [Enterovibrio nigricans DSM 22720]